MSALNTIHTIKAVKILFCLLILRESSKFSLNSILIKIINILIFVLATFNRFARYCIENVSHCVFMRNLASASKIKS